MSRNTTSARTRLDYQRRTVPQLLAAAAKDTDAASVFYNGTGPADYDSAIIVIKGRENVDYVAAVLERQQLVTPGKPVEGEAPDASARADLGLITEHGDGERRRIDANELERIARERPNERFLKGSGVLKLTGAIRQLEAEVRALKATAVAAPAACSSYECKAAQRDGVLCADGECRDTVGVATVDAPSIVRWLTAVTNNRRNTERARGAALALVDEWEGLEPPAPGVTSASAPQPADEPASPALARHRRLIATLPQTAEDAEALRAGHREPWRVDLPDGAYTQLPGDPPGPADLRRVQDGIVYDVQPRTGRLLLAAKPRNIPGGATTAIRADDVQASGGGRDAG